MHRMKKEIKVNKRLQKLWHEMNPTDRKLFASLVGKTVGSFRHVAEGRRGVSSDLAIRIEDALRMLDMKVQINRTELNETCRRCSYAKACLGKSR